MTIRLTLPLALLTVAILVVAGAIPAAANWFGPTGYARDVNSVYACGGGNITDNKEVTFAFDDATVADVRNATNWTRTNLLNPTALEAPAPIENPGPHVDIYVISKNYSNWCEAEVGAQWTTDGVNGLRGLTNCEKKVEANRRCDKANVRLANAFFDNHGNPGDRFLTCHEIGHAIGLRHRNAAAGCMYKCVDVSARAYTPHDIDHFDADWTTLGASGTEPC